jgi:hypothetical protein
MNSQPAQVVQSVGQMVAAAVGLRGPELFRTLLSVRREGPEAAYSVSRETDLSERS